MKDLIKQPSRDGPTFGKHLSGPEKAAFQRQRARELKALKSGCTNDHCEALRESSNFGGVRRSLAAFPVVTETCLETYCSDHFQGCQTDDNCGWWLDNCMDENNLPDSCTDQAQKAKYALKSLTECYFDNCDTDSDGILGSGSGTSNGDGVSPVGFIPYDETDAKSLSDCLSPTCKSDYELCADNSGCTSYLSECLETGESALETCQQYRTKALVAVKFLIYY